MAGGRGFTAWLVKSDCLLLASVYDRHSNVGFFPLFFSWFTLGSTSVDALEASTSV